MERSLLGSFPPWLFLWIIFFLISVPSLLSRSLYSVCSTLQGTSQTDVYGTSLAPLLAIPAILEFATLLALVLGICAVFLPRRRALYVENENNLKDVELSSDSLKEIKDFIHGVDSSIRIKSNLTSFAEYAFVYPLGFGSFAIAITGGLVKLWNKDRQQAEAILLHEIAHCQNGDALVVGAGSFLERFIRYWWLLAIAFFIIPVVFVAIDLFSNIFALGLFSYIGIIFAGLVSSILGLLLWSSSLLVVPIAAIWSTEFAADTAALNGRPAGLRAALVEEGRRPNWRDWLLRRISHPPQLLRAAFVARSNKVWPMVLILLLLPLAYILQFFLLIIHGLLVSASNDIGEVDLALWAAIFFDSMTWPLFVMAGAVAIAPWLPFLKGGKICFRDRGYGEVQPYLIAAGILGVVALITIPITPSYAY